MPHVTVHPGTERKPVYQVGGKSFVFFRNPRPDAFDPDTGQRYDDVIVFWVPDEGDKLALVQDDSSPFFTTPHFNGHLSVLLRASRLGEISHAELTEVVQEAWLSRASAATPSGVARPTPARLRTTFPAGPPWRPRALACGPCAFPSSNSTPSPADVSPATRPQSSCWKRAVATRARQRRLPHGEPPALGVPRGRRVPHGPPGPHGERRTDTSGPVGCTRHRPGGELIRRWQQGHPGGPGHRGSTLRARPVLGREDRQGHLVAHQASARGGDLVCRLVGDRVHLRGSCALYLDGHIELWSAPVPVPTRRREGR